MQTFLIIALVVFFSYVSYILIRFKKVPKSLSETFYMLGEPWGYSFTVMMTVLAVAAAAAMLEVTPEDRQVLAFFPPLGIAFVGAAPCFKRDEYTEKVHVTGALVAAISGIVWTVFAVHSFPMVVFSGIACIILACLTGTTKSGKTWWFELFVFLTVFLTLISKL